MLRVFSVGKHGPRDHNNVRTVATLATLVIRA